MNRNLKLVVAVLMLGIPFITFAKSKSKPKKKAKADFTLIEAYTQRTLPGMPGTPPEIAHHFVIVWQQSFNMTSCFWRGENGWMTCNMQKAHKITHKDARSTPAGIDYMLDDIDGELHIKDTVMLTPVRGGKFPIPKEIPASARNTIFYQTSASGEKWLSFPVKTIGKKRDIPMP